MNIKMCVLVSMNIVFLNVMISAEGNRTESTDESKKSLQDMTISELRAEFQRLLNMYQEFCKTHSVVLAKKDRLNECMDEIQFEIEKRHRS